MRLVAINARGVKPIERFEVSNLSDVVVLAGPNGVGKSRLVTHLLQHFQGAGGPGVSVGIEATDEGEEKIWGKKSLDTSVPADRTLLQRSLQRNRLRRNFQSSVIYFESDRSIQNIANYAFTWDVTDPWLETVVWNSTIGGLRNRFQDTLHSIFRKVKSLEGDIARRARDLKKAGSETMPLDFEDPLNPFREVFFQLLAPKTLVDADARLQKLTYSFEGQTFGIESLSSGEREVLNITFDFLLRSPSDCIVFFDEPELHLHPELSYRLLNTLRSIGSRNQFLLCTHSPDIISATLDQSVVFIAPKKADDVDINQAIVVTEDDDTNQALRLLGHSIGIVALGKRIVLIEGTQASLDKQLYGALLKSKYPSLVLVPSGGKQSIISFQSVVENVLQRTIWGVEFFMLCDQDSAPWGSPMGDVEEQSKGRLRCLSKYHIENYFLDEETLAKVFDPLEPKDSWLRSPVAIREELRKIGKSLISYAVALRVSREFRLSAGNVDLMPKGCHGKSEAEIVAMLSESSKAEGKRIVASLDEAQIAAGAEKYFRELNELLDADNPKWKDVIPGKQLLARFASKSRIDLPRLKSSYMHSAEAMGSKPFAEVDSIFQQFSKI